MDLAIQASGLAKKYKIDKMQKLSDRSLREDIMGLFRKKKVVHEEFWALKPIDFEIHRGEVVGLIGSNGSGKSTLLKILSRVTWPTLGEVSLFGKVGALLEVGTGFHVDLTGRENIFLSGAILGMKRKEVENHFDEIISFSGIEEFLDTPVKHYSSGMFLRLAFSVMAHLNSDILIVDEVIAVGDAEFQEKCLEKMRSIAAQGKTVILVSHQLDIVKDLCNRVMWLHKGRLVADGETEAILERYESKAALQVT